MASRVMEISLALALVSVLFAHHASAQPATCTTAIVSLAPCLGYITGNSSTPSSSCCTQLDSVVKTQAQCLCTLLNGGASSFGLSINQTQALALPGACKVQTPPLSQCNAAAPAQSPTATPDTPAAVPSAPTTPSTPAGSSPAAPSTPPVPKVPSGKGSNAVPTAESSDGSSYISTSSMMFSTLFLVLCISSTLAL
ncbi:non-specific lipid-transfer protein-like protein [Iris pallida]|uniref:Non-specific lipid-transfer protein-like protein n=1 Tax=Iris pallida TaxID=29817 RepID=A0AAX6DYQ5_IRIPA|nr:non-specific lipid-transfer protein-like protein [Iris pallida]KAJ6847087.1 non-specific lipid-transfer protein-like protein [Iris pallida]